MSAHAHPVLDVTGHAPAVQMLRYVLRLADTNLILAQRLGEWVGHAPTLEEDLGLANIALDVLGRARLCYGYAAEIEGNNRSEDDFAFLREQGAYLNFTLVEQPNGDFAHTIVRQWLIDAYQLEYLECLTRSRDVRLAEIARKAVKEARYHLRFSSGWVIRLGDGTVESHDRCQAALAALWRYVPELFDADELDLTMHQAGIAPALNEVEASWSCRIDDVLLEATLKRPPSTAFKWYGKQGMHSEHLGYLLAELQYLPRAYPGAHW